MKSLMVILELWLTERRRRRLQNAEAYEHVMMLSVLGYIHTLVFNGPFTRESIRRAKKTANKSAKRHQEITTVSFPRKY